ncbi:hypothetical protein H9P43_007701 [Blastocladiella emersonii ATCC 22665]|nr:hypothetical protein H9P43_007701 [Blastocladiella emersonii ATCC 22665]
MNGFTLINYYRLFRMCYKSMEMWIKFLGVLVAFLVLINTAVTLTYLVFVVQGRQLSEMTAINQALGAAGILDAIVNFAQAMTFVAHLQCLAGGNGEMTMRHGFRELLRHSQVMLFIEGAFTLTLITSFIAIFAFEVDPLWILCDLRSH